MQTRDEFIDGAVSVFRAAMNMKYRASGNRYKDLLLCAFIADHAFTAAANTFSPHEQFGPGGE